MLADKLKEIRDRIERDHDYGWRQAMLDFLKANEPPSGSGGDASPRRPGRADVQGGG